MTIRLDRLLLSFIITFLLTCCSRAAELPKEKWKVMANPAKHGWSPQKMKAAVDYAKASGSSALMVVQDGVVVAEAGDIDRKISSYSFRKSLISALYGIYSAEGTIDINQTLAQLGIDDNPPSLTKDEKQARIVDLLRARSGVYHPVDFETEYMIKQGPRAEATRPERSGTTTTGTSMFSARFSKRKPGSPSVKHSTGALHSPLVCRISSRKTSITWMDQSQCIVPIILK